MRCLPRSWVDRWERACGIFGKPARAGIPRWMQATPHDLPANSVLLAFRLAWPGEASDETIRSIVAMDHASLDAAIAQGEAFWDGKDPAPTINALKAAARDYLGAEGKIRKGVRLTWSEGNVDSNGGSTGDEDAPIPAGFVWSYLPVLRQGQSGEQHAGCWLPAWAATAKQRLAVVAPCSSSALMGAKGITCSEGVVKIHYKPDAAPSYPVLEQASVTHYVDRSAAEQAANARLTALELLGICQQRRRRSCSRPSVVASSS